MLTSEQIYRLNRMNQVAGAVALGTKLHQVENLVKAQYDVAVHGGGVGAHSLLVDLPDTAVITDVFGDVLTAMASAGNAGTIAFHVQNAGDLLAAVDADTLSGRFAGVPRPQTPSTFVKLTAIRTITATVAVEALTQGKVNLFVKYVLSA